MRDDMAKVVTEGPRRGHGNASKKTSGPWIRTDDPQQDYDGPRRRPVARGRQDGCNAIGPDRVAYSNRRRWLNTEVPVDGPYVHPKTAISREQRLREL